LFTWTGEGCPSATFKDIWFVVDVDSRKGQPGLSDMRSFLKGLITYLPVSQVTKLVFFWQIYVAWASFSVAFFPKTCTLCSR